MEESPRLEKESFRIAIYTFNVGGNDPPDNVRDFLSTKDSEISQNDMYVLGFQEVNALPHNYLKDIIIDDPWTDWFSAVLCRLEFVKLKDVKIQGLFLIVFVKMKHLPFIKNLQTDQTKTGTTGVFGSKGAVTIRMDLYGQSLCLVNSHLEAHLSSWEKRDENYQQIVAQQKFDNCSTPTLIDHQYLFWFGDLNYRIIDLEKSEIVELLARGELAALVKRDQLSLSQRRGTAFVGFHEGPEQGQRITFPPTYKFDVGTHIYDTSEKQRKPAYCDRVLWRTGGSPEVTPPPRLLEYGSIPIILCSDHQPVRAIFEIPMAMEGARALVDFRPISHWRLGQSNECAYTVCQASKTSGWDWLGLYQLGFRHPKDYHTWVFASPETKSVMGLLLGRLVAFEDLPHDHINSYCVGYYSSQMGALWGISNPFKILPSLDSSYSSSSSSSGD